MLSPEYISSLPDYMLELWGQVEIDILQDMARRIGGFDMFIPSAQHQMRALEEMGMVRENIVRSLSAITGKTEHELATLLRDAGIESLKSDDAVYVRAGLNPAPLRASYHLQNILQTGLSKTMGEFENLTLTTARTASRQFERALDKAYMQITMGGMDYNSAIRSAIKDLSRNGVAAITYPASGHTDNMDVAVRRATVTGVNQTLGRMQEARARELGWDLMELTAHSGARPSHAEWQGEIVSLSGAKGYLSTADIGYGTGEGFKGWNCNHDWRPYDPDMPRTYSKELLEDYKAKTYEYNGQKLTQYEAQQAQRQLERNTRRWKREYLAMDAAGQPTGESAAKLKEWRDREKDFLAQTGLKKQYDRQAVVGFGRSEAARATADAKRNTLTNAAGQRIIEVKKTTANGAPNSITQHTGKTGRIDRNYYGTDGNWVKQISSSNHGNPKTHPFGENGEHAHDILWKDGEIENRTTRELTEAERKENGDIV